MNMFVRLIAVLVSLTITLSVSAASWQDNSHYVALGPRTGSSLSHQLGIDDAPMADTDDPFNHGYGTDALAFRFNGAGILSAARLYRAGDTEPILHSAAWFVYSRAEQVAGRESIFWSTAEDCPAARRFHRLLHDPGLQPVWKSFRWRKAMTNLLPLAPAIDFAAMPDCEQMNLLLL
jgi:hypothetical protein